MVATIPDPAYYCRMRTVGRSAVSVDVEVVREITEDDLMLLEEPRPKSTAPVVKQLRERHHALARLLAAGIPHWEAAAITGYEPSRVSILRRDPAFQNLISFYTEKKDAAFADVHANLNGLTVDALSVIRERLEENPDDFSNHELRELVKVGADRSGHGPTNTNIQVNVGLAQRLEAARKRVIEARAIDITPEDEAA